MSSKRKHVMYVFMIVGLIFSLGVRFSGPGLHKSIGLLTVILFVVHSIQNRRWYRSVFSGKYSALRIAQMITHMLIVAALAGIAVSGVILSGEVYAPVENQGMSAGRILHLLSSCMLCLAVVFHVGFHLKRRRNYV